MTDAREQILARIHTAIRTTSPTPSPPQPAPPLPQPPPAAELLEQFIERLTDYGTTVTQCQPQAVHYAVLAACQRHDAQRVVIAPGLPDEWRPDGIDLIPDAALSPQQLDSLDGVITAAALGIAQTGTIALDAASDQGRRALTLVPDLHICVLDADHIVASLPEAIETLAPSVRNGQPITLISGPSATSDIELRRVQGVHGPRKLDVIIVVNNREPASDAQRAESQQRDG